MTHPIPWPSKVGYQNQRYEVTVFDETLNIRVVLGWTRRRDIAQRMATDASLRPSWSFAQVTDLWTDITTAAKKPRQYKSSEVTK